MRTSTAAVPARATNTEPQGRLGVRLPYAVVAINSAASMMGGDLPPPFCIDRGPYRHCGTLALKRLPLTLPVTQTVGEPTRLG